MHGRVFQMRSLGAKSKVQFPKVAQDKIKVSNKFKFSNLKDCILAVLQKNAKLLPGLGERRVKVSRNVADNCRYSNLFLFLGVYV